MLFISYHFNSSGVSFVEHLPRKRQMVRLAFLKALQLTNTIKSILVLCLSTVFTTIHVHVTV